MHPEDFSKDQSEIGRTYFVVAPRFLGEAQPGIHSQRSTADAHPKNTVAGNKSDFFALWRLCVRYFWGFFLTLLCFSTACVHDPIKADLIIYLNQDILRIASLETTALRHYSSVSGQNYKSDAALEAALNDQVLPIYQKFLRRLEQIQPQTFAVSKVHQKYVEGARGLYEGFKLLHAAIQMQNAQMVGAANTRIQQGTQSIQEWRESFLSLCQKHNVKVAM